MRIFLARLGVTVLSVILLLLLLLLLSWCQLTFIGTASTASAVVPTFAPTSVPTVTLSGDFGFNEGVTWPVSAVLNQQGPSCVGYAWATWEGALPALPRPMDGLDIYREAQRVDEWPGEAYDGTSVRAGAFVLGMAHLISPVYTTTESVYEAVNFMRWHGPVVIQSFWYRGMDSPASDGYAIPSGPIYAQHAYMCNNYVDSGVHGESFGCFNTYGTYWGNRGRFRLHLRDLRYLMGHGAYAALAEKNVNYQLNYKLGVPHK